MPGLSTGPTTPTHTRGRHTSRPQADTDSLSRYGSLGLRPTSDCNWPLVQRDPRLIMPGTEVARKRAHRKRHKFLAMPICPKSHRLPNGATIRPITTIPGGASHPNQAAIPDHQPDRRASLMTSDRSGKSVVPSDQPLVLHVAFGPTMSPYAKAQPNPTR